VFDECHFCDRAVGLHSVRCYSRAKRSMEMKLGLRKHGRPHAATPAATGSVEDASGLEVKLARLEGESSVRDRGRAAREEAMESKVSWGGSEKRCIF